MYTRGEKQIILEAAEILEEQYYDNPFSIDPSLDLEGFLETTRLNSRQIEQLINLLDTVRATYEVRGDNLKQSYVDSLQSLLFLAGAPFSAQNAQDSKEKWLVDRLNEIHNYTVNWDRSKDDDEGWNNPLDTGDPENDAQTWLDRQMAPEYIDSSIEEAVLEILDSIDTYFNAVKLSDVPYDPSQDTEFFSFLKDVREKVIRKYGNAVSGIKPAAWE